MACTLLKAECVDHKLGIYKMEFWADKLSDIKAPDSMIMCGGSKAVITNSSGVTCYQYDSSANEWREDANGFNIA